MRLKDWREAQEPKLTQAGLAARCRRAAWPILGRPRQVGQQAIARLEGGQLPPRDLMALLWVVTDGAVSANDFYDLPDLPDCRARLRQAGAGAPAEAGGA